MNKSTFLPFLIFIFYYLGNAAPNAPAAAPNAPAAAPNAPAAVPNALAAAPNAPVAAPNVPVAAPNAPAIVPHAAALPVMAARQPKVFNPESRLGGGHFSARIGSLQTGGTKFRNCYVCQGRATCLPAIAKRRQTPN